MSGGRIRLRTWQYGISSLIGWKDDVLSLVDWLPDDIEGLASSSIFVAGSTGGGAVSTSFKSEESSTSATASPAEIGF